MTARYARPDWEVVDYQMYCLDPKVVDRQTNTGLMLRGPAPQKLEKGAYFVCIGAAQTFGRFCEKPYPTLLQERLDIQALNLGRGGAGPSFFSRDSRKLLTYMNNARFAVMQALNLGRGGAGPSFCSRGSRKLLTYINNARFAIIQVMSGRSESNSLFASQGLGYYTRISDGTEVGCDQAFHELIEENDEGYVRQIVAETRRNWIDSYKRLLEQIRIPKILFWFSVRAPRYTERYGWVYALFGEFPQLVNADMIDQLREHSDEYVECISRRGSPHPLVNRFTGEPTTVNDPWGGIWRENRYYPSPEMHMDAANALEKACKRYLNPVERHQRSKLPPGLGRWLWRKQEHFRRAILARTGIAGTGR